MLIDLNSLIRYETCVTSIIAGKLGAIRTLIKCIRKTPKRFAERDLESFPLLHLAAGYGKNEIVDVLVKYHFFLNVRIGKTLTLTLRKQ